MNEFQLLMITQLLGTHDVLDIETRDGMLRGGTQVVAKMAGGHTCYINDDGSLNWWNGKGHQFSRNLNHDAGWHRTHGYSVTHEQWLLETGGHDESCKNRPSVV